MPNIKDRSGCYGCRCETCRWKGAGSLCHYNEHGQDTSRCSWCMEGVRQEDLAAWKEKSFSCRGYEKRGEGGFKHDAGRSNHVF